MDVLAHYREQALSVQEGTPPAWLFMEDYLAAEYQSNTEKLRELFGYELFNNFLYNVENTP
jgi:hypothetical protein